jgi:hypothetical protein
MIPLKKEVFVFYKRPAGVLRKTQDYSVAKGENTMSTRWLVVQNIVYICLGFLCGSIWINTYHYAHPIFGHNLIHFINFWSIFFTIWSSVLVIKAFIRENRYSPRYRPEITIINLVSLVFLGILIAVDFHFFPLLFA